MIYHWGTAVGHERLGWSPTVCEYEEMIVIDDRLAVGRNLPMPEVFSHGIAIWMETPQDPAHTLS